MPTQEELEKLERATKVSSPSAVSFAVLADAYRETSLSMKSNRSGGKENPKLLGEAKQLYKKALEMDRENSDILRRCGNGLMKLPHPHKDVPLAKVCLTKAITINPNNSAAYQALGTLEDRYNKKPREALRYYQLSYEKGNHISALFILEVQLKIKESFNPLPDIDKFMTTLGDGHELYVDLLVCKGEYLLLRRNDLVAAANFWKEAIELKPKSEYVTNHVCRFISAKRTFKPYLKIGPGRTMINVYVCLKHEIRNALKGSKLSSENENALKEVLKLCEKYNSK